MDLLLSEKYLGLASLTILLTGLIFLVRKWPRDVYHTFSQHAATNKASTIYYTSLFTVVLPILATFLFNWFVPAFNIPMIFTILISLSLICQYVCTFVPEVGKNVKSHQVLAGVSGLLLLPSLAVFIYVPSIDQIDKIITITSVVIMSGIVLQTSRRKTRYALLLQSAYFIAFFAPIVAISYI
jgi:hypothetical protein